MPLKYPDIFEPNNPLVAQLDSEFVRGGVKKVADTTALYALSSKTDQLTEYVTEVYVSSLGYRMLLIDISNVSNSLGWNIASFPLDTTPTNESVNGITSNAVYQGLLLKQDLSAKNQNNGYAGLDNNGFVPLSLFPDQVLGNVKYKGTYDGVTITSADSTYNGQPLPTSTNSIQGIYFISTNTYTVNSIVFAVGDWIISDGNAGWSVVRNSDAVTTVFGRVGNISAQTGDYSAFYPLLNGTNATGTWGINISGSASQWSSQTFSSTPTTSPSSLMAKDTSGNWQPAVQSTVQSFLGLGSNAFTSTSYYPASNPSSFITGAYTGFDSRYQLKEDQRLSQNNSVLFAGLSVNQNGIIVTRLTTAGSGLAAVIGSTIIDAPSTSTLLFDLFAQNSTDASANRYKIQGTTPVLGGYNEYTINLGTGGNVAYTSDISALSTVYQPLENQRLSTSNNVSFASSTTTTNNTQNVVIKDSGGTTQYTINLTSTTLQILNASNAQIFSIDQSGNVIATTFTEA